MSQDGEALCVPKEVMDLVGTNGRRWQHAKPFPAGHGPSIAQNRTLCIWQVEDFFCIMRYDDDRVEAEIRCWNSD